uniref:Calcium uniporter protein n=1 Tax=Elaeophora elaphi TaxID=1147741 RepID=A0A0R3RY65_9BILA
MGYRWYNITGLLRQQQYLHEQLLTYNTDLNYMHQLGIYSNNTMKKNLRIWYENDLPIIQVPLPSRREMCQFTLKPISDTVSLFCENIECEDKGIEVVYVHSISGNRIAGSTSVQHLLLQGNFKLRINDFLYTVEVPSSNDTIAMRRNAKIDDVKLAIASLYAVMNVVEYEACRERMLLEEYQNAKLKIDALCKKRAKRMSWLALICIGF